MGNAYPNPLKFVDECVGFSHDQKDMELGARDAVTTKAVGYISYSIFQDEINIKMVDVHPKRQGIATQLYQKLKSLHPGMKINHGMTTDEGEAWLKSQPDPHVQYLGARDWIRRNCVFAQETPESPAQEPPAVPEPPSSPPAKPNAPELTIPAGATLFHGSLESFPEPELRTGGDDILWTTDDKYGPGIAQSYIPTSGSAVYITPNSLVHPTQDETLQKLQQALGIIYDYNDPEAIEWDRTGRAQSFRIAKKPDGTYWGHEFSADPKDKEREPLTAIKVDELLKNYGFKPKEGASSSPEWNQYEIRMKLENGKFDFMPPNTKGIGRLFIITVQQPLRIYDHARGREGDLTDVDYHETDLFDKIEGMGFDGIRITDFAQVEGHGNVGHNSIGIFQHALGKLKWKTIPAQHPDFDLGSRTTPEWEAYRKTTAWVRGNCRFAARFSWPHSRVSARDYLNYHRQLLAGHMDVPLLRKMIADVTPMVEYVWENSKLRHHPDYGKRCEKCQEDMQYLDTEKGDPNLLQQHDAGYWECQNCGSIEGWEETLSKRKDDRGRWMYTDAFQSLDKWLLMTQSKDAGTANAGLEAILQFAHMSGPQSNWFIEGGTTTIDKVRAMGGMEPPLRAWLNGNCKFAQVAFPPEIVKLVKVNPYQALRNMLEERPELIPAFLNAYKQAYAPRKVSFKSAAPVIVVKIGNQSYVVENDTVKDAGEFIVDKSERELFAYVPARDFNKEFWQFPEILFHATDPKNAQSIIANGLKPDNRTRGIANRATGSAVFASTDMETISSYGSVIIAIDTRAMKADGYTPRAAMESPLEEENMRSALAHKLGVEYISEPEAGLDERTVAIFGPIPAKYLKPMGA